MRRKHRLAEWARAIKELRAAKRLNQTELAAEIGVTWPIVAAWEQGRKQPSTDRYIQLEQAVRQRVEKLRIPEMRVVAAPKVKASGQVKAGYVALPILKDPAAAGSPRMIDERQVEEYIVVSAKQARPSPDWLTCIKVAGDSMEPILKDGYLVAVDASVTDPRRLEGKMTVALVDEGVTIKWLERIGSQWVLTPENKAHPQRPLGRDDRIIGRVAWWYGHQE